MRGLERLAIADPGGDHLGDPAGAMPIGFDVLRCFFRPQSPADFTSMADLVIGCHEGDVALSKQLIGDLPVERLLVGLLLLFEKALPTEKPAARPSGGSRPPAL